MCTLYVNVDHLLDLLNTLYLKDWYACKPREKAHISYAHAVTPCTCMCDRGRIAGLSVCWHFWLFQAYTDFSVHKLAFLCPMYHSETHLVTWPTT